MHFQEHAKVTLRVVYDQLTHLLTLFDLLCRLRFLQDLLEFALFFLFSKLRLLELGGVVLLQVSEEIRSLKQILKALHPVNMF